MRPVALPRPLLWFAVVAIALAGALLLGCDGTHLAGTNDVTLDYAIQTTDAPAGKPVANVAAAAKARLAAGHLTADADTDTPGHLHATLDGDLADAADDLLTWRGGLAFYRVDPAFHVAAPAGAGVTEATDKLADGSTENYLVGPAAAIAHAVASLHVEAGHRVLAETIDAKTARTRAVFDPPVVDAADGVEKTAIVRRGHAVTIALKPAALADATARLAAPSAERGTIAVVRGRAVLAVRAIAAADLAPLTVDFGDDIYSYARAERVSSLLGTPPLPKLQRLAKTARSDDWPMAIVGLVLPMLLSFAWLFFVRRFDRGEPEPMWLVLATFALGGLSVVPAGFAEYAFMTASPYLNPSLVTFGGQPVAFPLAILVFTLVVGLSEEGSKLLGAWSLARHRREFDEPVDGIVYGVASALGFAAVENIKYFALGRLTPPLIVMRTFTSVPAHMFFAAIWGYAMGQKLVRKRTSLLLFLAWAALMHGAFDTFLSIHGMQVLAPALNFVLASLFVVFLRRALRHGVVRPGLAHVPPASRSLFGMGSGGVFTVWTIAMHVFAVFVFAVGVYFEMTHRRVSWLFLSASTSLLAGLGVSAFGVANSLPLDAVVDANGVTFAGVTRIWSEIARVDRRPAFGIFGGAAELWLRSAAGDLRVGPGSRESVDAAARTIEQRLRAAASA